tara:strand:+ start:627 stop:1289 length:663 start_codon:yes stop_codon:yes gene_type:complete
MKGLRALFDISSFFLIMIINLLLIALLCYYFKRKFENLEKAQMEQAKILYGLIENKNNIPVQNVFHQESVEDVRETQELHELLNSPSDTKSVQLTGNTIVSESEEEDESDSDDDDSEDDSEDTNASNPILNAVELQVEKLPADLQNVQPLDITNVTEVTDLTDVTDISPDIVKNVDVTPGNDSLQKLTVKQLNELLKEKGLKSGKNMKKVEIIELLQNTE